MSPASDAVWKSSAVAHCYLSGIRGAIPGAALQLEVMIRLLATLDAPVRRFLDLGCGDGALGAAVLDAYPEASGVFADFSEPMLDGARRRFDGQSNRYFVHVDYGDPNWVDAGSVAAPYDAVISGYSIHHQEDDGKRHVYAEVMRLLRPGGLFINIEHVLPSSILGQRLFEEHFAENMFAAEQRANGPRTRDQLREEFLHRKDTLANRLSPIDTQLDWLRTLGYRDVDCYMKLYELAIIAGRRPI